MAPSDQFLAEDDAARPYGCDELRIQEPGGATIIWPRFEKLVPIQAAYMRLAFGNLESFKDFPNMSDEQVLEAVGIELQQSREEFLTEREGQIAQYIEGPCQPLARRLMDHGKITYMSNAYNLGSKGIWWNEDILRSQNFFTSIITGQTYKIEKEGANNFYTPVDLGIDVSDCVADEGYFKQIGMATKPEQMKGAFKRRSLTGRPS